MESHIVLGTHVKMAIRASGSTRTLVPDLSKAWTLSEHDEYADVDHDNVYSSPQSRYMVAAR